MSNCYECAGSSCASSRRRESIRGISRKEGWQHEGDAIHEERAAREDGVDSARGQGRGRRQTDRPERHRGQVPSRGAEAGMRRTRGGRLPARPARHHRAYAPRVHRRLPHRRRFPRRRAGLPRGQGLVPPADARARPPRVGGRRRGEPAARLRVGGADAARMEIERWQGGGRVILVHDPDMAPGEWREAPPDWRRHRPRKAARRGRRRA